MAGPYTSPRPVRTTFRPVWTLAAVLLVVVMELFRGMNKDQAPLPPGGTSPSPPVESSQQDTPEPVSPNPRPLSPQKTGLNSISGPTPATEAVDPVKKEPTGM